MEENNNPNEMNNQQNNQTPYQQQYQQPNQTQYQQQYQQPQNNQAPYQQQYQQPQNNQQQYQQPQNGQPVYQQPQYSGQSQYQQQGQPQYQQPYNPYQQPPKKENGMAIGSLVCGIVSVVINCCIIVWWLSIAVAIAGIVLGIFSIKNNKDGKNMAMIGIILSGVGILLAIVVFVGCVLLSSSSNYYWNDIYNELGIY